MLTYAIVAVTCFHVALTAYKEHKNWAFHFPQGSNMGLYLALALPIEVPNENVFVAYNFEANYLLPNLSSTIDQFPPLAAEDEEEERKSEARTARSSLDRETLYRAVERKLEAYGYAGRGCLLRTVCEAADSPLEANGLLGDILHIVLAPSSTNETSSGSLLSAYEQAERIGRNHGDCRNYAKSCPTSLLNLITWLKN